jgi:hypothetical protein
VAPAGGSSYTTSFPLTENPISEGGMWINGGAVGLDWNNVRTESGYAHGSVLVAYPSRYSDDIAHLNPAFVAVAANQYAQGTVYRAAGYAPAGSGHEIELLLRFQITPHSARGYEVLWGHSGYLAIVRWNGPVSDYTPLLDTGDPGIGAPVDGDVLRAEIIGSVIKVYKNGSLVATGPSNTTWTDGQPGMGFWPVDSSTPQNLGWKDYTAGGL